MHTQAYFENIHPEIVKELQVAQHSIYVAVAWFTDRELFEILCNKARQKLAVSVLILNDEINTGNFGLDFNRLKEAGGNIHEIGSREEMMHNKFCVIDKKAVITGSYNWTHKAKTNDENVTVTKDSPALAADFITEFNRLYKKYIHYGLAPVVDIETLLKRLEIIKSTIAIQDTDDITYQTDKLKKLLDHSISEEDTKEVDKILLEIERKAYDNAMQMIAAMLDRYRSLTKYIDPEIQGLQLEIQSLSLQVAALENELADIEQTIHRFEVRHTKELGEIILKILFIKQKIAEKKAREQPENTEAQEEFQEARQEEQEYQDTVEEAKKNPVQELSAEEEQELKVQFRKITKWTHPDLVDKHFAKEATELFIKAKQAKDNNDLDTIRDIFEYLETGKPFKMKHETITKHEILRKEAKQLRHTVEQLLHKITSIKESETYRTIESIEDWNIYFTETKEKLQTELERLNTLEHA